MRDGERGARKEQERCICLSEFLSVCGGRQVGGSINHSQSFIFSDSYPSTAIGSARDCTPLHRQEKLLKSRLRKLNIRAVLMYTFGVFVQREELRLNACVSFARVVTNATSLPCMRPFRQLLLYFCFTSALQRLSQESLMWKQLFF